MKKHTNQEIRKAFKTVQPATAHRGGWATWRHPAIVGFYVYTIGVFKQGESVARPKRREVNAAIRIHKRLDAECRINGLKTGGFRNGFA